MVFYPTKVAIKIQLIAIILLLLMEPFTIILIYLLATKVKNQNVNLEKRLSEIFFCLLSFTILVEIIQVH